MCWECSVGKQEGITFDTGAHWFLSAFADVYSFDEEEPVLDPHIAKHLAHFGIDMLQMQVVGNPSFIKLVVHFFVHLGVGEQQEKNDTCILFVIPSDCYDSIQFCEVQPPNLGVTVRALSKSLLSNPEVPFWKRYL